MSEMKSMLGNIKKIMEDLNSRITTAEEKI